jgi:signal transduction histidine kinase
MPTSFRAKLILLIAATVAAAVGCVCALLIGFYYNRMKVEAVREANVGAEVLAHNLAATLLFDDPKAANETLTALEDNHGVVGAFVYRTDYAAFAQYRRANAQPPRFDPAALTDALHGNWLFARTAILDMNQERHGYLVVVVDMAPRYRQFWISAALSVLAAVVLTVLALLVAARFERNLTRPLASLADVAAKVSRTRDYSLRAPTAGEDEIARFAHAFNEMLDRIESQTAQRDAAQDALQQLNQTLEQRVADRTAVAEQRAVQLRALAAELTRTEERERRRLAYLIHDNLQQVLAAAKMQINNASRYADDSVRPWLNRCEALVRDAIAQSRSLTADLAPPILYSAGLGEAMHWLARQMLEKHDLAVQVEAEPDLPPLPDQTQAFLFRAVRELLFNVIKHANAQEATVRLGREDSAIRVSVEDRGRGFDPDAVSPQGASVGFGLFSIRERLEHFGGRFSIISAPEQGSKVTMVAPLSQPAGAEGEPLDAGAPAPQPDEEATATALGPVRVLLADDHKLMREGIAHILRSHAGLELVGEASDGIEAIELAKLLRPDVVLMDVTMPRMSGVEATAQITRVLPRTRVVGLSMHEEDEMGARMRQAGAADYMTKGGAAEALIGTIFRVAAAG